jgi:hypothetical protein
VLEFEILQTANSVTTILPDSVQSFFGREQMLGSLAEKSKQFDSFGSIKQSLEQHKKAILNKQDES